MTKQNPVDSNTDDSLPNGLCTLPVQKECLHINVCMSCTYFRATKESVEHPLVNFIQIANELLSRLDDLDEGDESA